MYMTSFGMDIDAEFLTLGDATRSLSIIKLNDVKFYHGMRVRDFRICDLEYQ